MSFVGRMMSTRSSQWMVTWLAYLPSYYGVSWFLPRDAVAITILSLCPSHSKRSNDAVVDNAEIQTWFAALDSHCWRRDNIFTKLSIFNCRIQPRINL